MSKVWVRMAKPKRKRQIKKPGELKLGRPSIDFDYDFLERALEINCTMPEVAGLMDVSVETVQTKIKERYGMHFSELRQRKSAKGKMSIRRKLYSKALDDGDMTALIWLSKNELGMSDRQTLYQTTDYNHIYKLDPDLRKELVNLAMKARQIKQDFDKKRIEYVNSDE